MNDTPAVNSHDYLSLEHITESDDNVLQLRLIGIEGTEVHAAYVITFDYYLTYAVTNEPYARPSDAEAYEGRLLRTYSESHWLDFVRKHFRKKMYETEYNARTDRQGEITHYCVTCLNHMIDVICYDQPEIERLSDT